MFHEDWFIASLSRFCEHYITVSKETTDPKCVLSDGDRQVFGRERFCRVAWLRDAKNKLHHDHFLSLARAVHVGGDPAVHAV